MLAEGTVRREIGVTERKHKIKNFNLCHYLGFASEKAMANNSSILAWRIPWTEEPGGLHTVHGVTKIWRPRKQPTHTHTHTHR